jgi:hypothetical protein
LPHRGRTWRRGHDDRRLLAASPYRWHEAHARRDYGAALRRAGHRVQARGQLRLAIDYCARNGVLYLAERARDEL